MHLPCMESPLNEAGTRISRSLPLTLNITPYSNFFFQTFLCVKRMRLNWLLTPYFPAGHPPVRTIFTKQ